MRIGKTLVLKEIKIYMNLFCWGINVAFVIFHTNRDTCCRDTEIDRKGK